MITSEGELCFEFCMRWGGSFQKGDAPSAWGAEKCVIEIMSIK